MKFDGRKLADEIEQQVMQDVAKLTKKPHIVSFLVGNDTASEIYTRLKAVASSRVGIDFRVIRLDSAESLPAKIVEVAYDRRTTGIMLQLPLPGLSSQETNEMIKLIPLNLDVDGMRYPESLVVPPTVRAVMTILKEIGPISTRSAVVVGASGSVGRALVLELTKAKAFVIPVERDTDREEIKKGDIVISCVGKPSIVSDWMVKDQAIVIDVGISRVGNKVVGDMTQEVYQKASISLEVPGGVGPVTVACLMRSGYELARLLK